MRFFDTVIACAGTAAVPLFMWLTVRKRTGYDVTNIERLFHFIFILPEKSL